MRYISIFIVALTALSLSCKSSLKLSKNGKTSSEISGAAPAAVEDKAAKLTSEDCTDPDLSKVASDQSFMLCDGTIASGTYTPDFPDPADVLTTATVDGVVGTYIPPTPNEWDLRYGVTVGATTGKLKMNCRNLVGNWDGTAHTGGSSTLHTIDDFNAVADSGASGDFPSTNPWSSDEYFCGFNDPTEATWELVDDVTAGAPEGDAIYKDKISGLKWTRGNPSIIKDWDDAAGGGPNTGAIEYCTGLTHGSGGDTWRLPTQKELMAAYEHGIHDLDSEHTDPGGDNLGDLDAGFWSSSTRSFASTKAWFVTLSNGYTNNNLKNGSIIPVICVAP